VGAPTCSSALRRVHSSRRSCCWFRAPEGTRRQQLPPSRERSGPCRPASPPGGRFLEAPVVASPHRSEAQLPPFRMSECRGTWIPVPAPLKRLRVWCATSASRCLRSVAGRHGGRPARTTAVTSRCGRPCCRLRSEELGSLARHGLPRESLPGATRDPVPSAHDWAEVPLHVPLRFCVSARCVSTEAEHMFAATHYPAPYLVGTSSFLHVRSRLVSKVVPFHPGQALVATCGSRWEWGPS